MCCSVSSASCMTRCGATSPPMLPHVARRGGPGWRCAEVAVESLVAGARVALAALLLACPHVRSVAASSGDLQLVAVLLLGLSAGIAAGG